MTLRAQRGLPSFRGDSMLHVVSLAIRAGQRERFRITHFSIQHDHLHLLVEATSAAELSAGMRGLVIRIARQVNKALGRRGAVWADRWHGRRLTTPREVRTALAYVLFNGRKHHAVPFGLDPCASVVWSADVFADRVYRDGLRAMATGRAPPVVGPRTWLLAKGWRKHGLLRLVDCPRRRPVGRNR